VGGPTIERRGREGKRGDEEKKRVKERESQKHTFANAVGAAVVLAFVDIIHPSVEVVSLPSATRMDTPPSRILGTSTHAAGPVQP
jgi:hypothetical protein